jgi:predicted XRE-type DNA-binding protein
VPIARKGLTQAQAAERLGVVQPRVSEIARNKVDILSLDYLVGLCAKAGVSVAVRLSPNPPHPSSPPTSHCRVVAVRPLS